MFRAQETEEKQFRVHFFLFKEETLLRTPTSPHMSGVSLVPLTIVLL